MLIQNAGEIIVQTFHFLHKILRSWRSLNWLPSSKPCGFLIVWFLINSRHFCSLIWLPSFSPWSLSFRGNRGKTSCPFNFWSIFLQESVDFLFDSECVRLRSGERIMVDVRYRSEGIDSFIYRASTSVLTTFVSGRLGLINLINCLFKLLICGDFSNILFFLAEDKFPSVFLLV